MKLSRMTASATTLASSLTTLNISQIPESSIANYTTLSNAVFDEAHKSDLNCNPDFGIGLDVSDVLNAINDLPRGHDIRKYTTRDMQASWHLPFFLFYSKWTRSISSY